MNLTQKVKTLKNCRCMVDFFPWILGYKVMRMCFDPVECDVFEVETDEWRRLSPPPYEVDAIGLCERIHLLARNFICLQDTSLRSSHTRIP